MRRHAALAWLALTAAVLCVGAPDARAEDSDDSLFTEAVTALDKGQLDEAVDRFELLADRGYTHPDASYNRALAYTRRAGSHGAHRGDLGRAAAALEETLIARPDDGDARVAMERVRQEIARRRARAGASQVDQRPSLGWAVVGLLEEDTWAALAALGSLVASLGLAACFATRRDTVRLAGVVASSLGTLTLAVTGTLSALSRYERVHFRPAVVIVEEARLLDENGATISGPGSIVPEGAAVRVVDQRGTLAKVEWGTLDGWLSFGQLRLVARP